MKKPMKKPAELFTNEAGENLVPLGMLSPNILGDRQRYGHMLELIKKGSCVGEIRIVDINCGDIVED